MRDFEIYVSFELVALIVSLMHVRKRTRKRMRMTGARTSVKKQ
jgi:hypothetical protein